MVFRLISKLRLHFVLFPMWVGLISVSCQKTQEVTSDPETYSVMVPVVKDTAFASEYVADIHAIQNIELRSRVDGFLESIHVDEGMYVKSGQLLFTISSHEYKQRLQKCRAALTSALAEVKASELELANVKSLYEKNLVSRSELNLAEAKLEALKAHAEEANAEVANAELQVSFTQIKAPFNGVINRIPNKVGSLIDEGTLLTTISDDSEVFAYFNVSEKDYLDIASRGGIKNKQEISLSLANGKTHKSKGIIETVEGQVDKSTGTIAFRARFPNPERLIKHGSSGKVTLTNALEHAVLVPQKSTFEIQDNLYVYVVDESNKVHLRSFQPKLRLPHLYVVESGLTTKDRIIYEGIQRVKEGDLVQVDLIRMDNILAALTTDR